jgi:hypothetical protein
MGKNLDDPALGTHIDHAINAGQSFLQNVKGIEKELKVKVTELNIERLFHLGQIMILQMTLDAANKDLADARLQISNLQAALARPRVCHCDHDPVDVRAAHNPPVSVNQGYTPTGSQNTYTE